jgi:hypothetical protein
MTQIIPYPAIETINLNSTRSWTDNDNYRYYIEEKIDGSQFSMILNDNNTLSFYNKKSLINNTNTTFMKTISMLKFNFENKNILNPNYIYHGESVCKLKHNVVVYERTPKNYFICYDIFDISTKTFLSPELKKTELDRVGLEMVPILFYNQDPNISPYDKCKELISQIEENNIKSYLGGTPEGIVLKHHAFKQHDKTSATKLKYVTTIFKERHQTKQPKFEASADDFLEQLGKSFSTEARFQKAYQHLVENERIDSTNVKRNDLDKIIGELGFDFDKEYKEEMMLLLWVEFSPIIKKYARENVGRWFTDNFLNK